MRRTQRSITCSPFFSFIFIFHFMVCSPYPVRASQPLPFFDYGHEEQAKNIKRGLPEDVLKHLIGYLPQKDALSLSGVSKTIYTFKPLFIEYAIKPSEVHKGLVDIDASQSSAVALTERTSDISQAEDLYAKLLAACGSFILSNEPSLQHATLLYLTHSPNHIEHASVLENFFKRDKYGVLLPKKEKDKPGNHSTNSLGQVHVKADDYFFNNEKITPLDFMMEKAVSLLSSHLFPEERLIAYSQIATFNNLHKVKIVEGHDTYLSAIPGLVQIAERIDGIRLDEVLKQIPSQGYTAWFKDQFSLTSYQSFVLLSFLMHPADYKADNIMLRREKDDVYHLVGIDNDMAFADSVVKLYDEATHVGVKNILYALPLMDEPFTQEIIQTIKSWNPALIIIQWLRDLDLYNQHYASLFKGRFKDKYNEIPLWIDIEGKEPYPTRFPLKLRKGTALKLYEDLCQLKNLVEEQDINQANQKQLTLHNVFTQLDPLLAAYYGWLREEYKKTVILQGAVQAYKNVSESLYTEGTWKKLEDLFEQGILDQTLQPHLVFSKDAKAYLKERTQPLETSLRELFSVTTLDNILSAKKLTPTTLKWMLKTIEPEIQELEFSLQIILQASPHISVENSLSLLEVLLTYCKSKFYGSQEVSAYYNFLNRVDQFGRTALHQAVNLFNSVSLKQIQSLVYFGANLEVQDNYNCTPLDLAADNKQTEIFIKLVSLGAGKAAQINKIHRYYKTLSLDTKKQVYEKFTEVNPELAWLISLDTLLPFKKPGELLRTISEGSRYIPSSLSSNLFDAQGNIRKKNQHGRRAVPQLNMGPYSLHMKVYPELPGMEMAVSRLIRLLGYEAPYSELAELRGMPILLTQTIPGETLYNILTNKPQLLEKLDPYHLSMALVMAMLTNPEDGNPTNYIMSPYYTKEGEERYKIISIDHDHSFMPAVAKEIKDGKNKKPSLQVKTILFSLDQMNKPVHLEVVNKFKALDPLEILRPWLEHLNLHDQQAKAHFDGDDLISLAGNKDTVIGVPFSPGMLTQLYTKMVRLQMALARKTVPTHFELLTILEPYLGQRYERAYKANVSLSVWERFKKIDGKYYNILEEGNIISTASLADVLASSDIPDKETLQRALWQNKYGPSQALEELKTIEKEYTSYEHILKELKVANPNRFKDIQIEGLQEKLLRYVNFRDLSVAQQQVLIRSLQAKSLQKIRFLNANGLTNSLFSKLPFTHVTTLNLKGCNGVNTLNGTMPVLHSLYIKDCENLNTIKLKAPELTKLRIHKVPSLTLSGLRGLTQDTPHLIIAPGDIEETGLTDKEVSLMTYDSNFSWEILSPHYFQKAVKEAQEVSKDYWNFQPSYSPLMQRMVKDLNTDRERYKSSVVVMGGYYTVRHTGSNGDGIGVTMMAGATRYDYTTEHGFYSTYFKDCPYIASYLEALHIKKEYSPIFENFFIKNANKMTNLKSLKLYVPDRSISLLSEHPTKNQLLTPLSFLTQLQELYLYTEASHTWRWSSFLPSSFPSVLLTLRELHTLTFDNVMTKEDFKLLAPSIASLTQLHILHLIKCYFDKKEEIISNAFISLTNLTTLRI